MLDGHANTVGYYLFFWSSLHTKKLNVSLDSDVVHLNLAGTHLMIVNTAEAVSELFEHRSAIYSDRVRCNRQWMKLISNLDTLQPRLPMLVEL